ncbi:MAG: SprB repeat-containing protein [Bacteroidales bacterium]|nr:SprB repeat-containing protein [Bacteroidales bacterium]
MKTTLHNMKKIIIRFEVIAVLLFFSNCNALISQIQITKTDVTCTNASDGTATVTGVNNGTPPFTYNWSNGGTGTSINNLAEGTYSVTVTDAHLCTGTKEVTIELSMTTLDVDINTVDETCEGTADGMVIAWVNTGTGPYTYVWSNGGSGYALLGVSAGTYSVVVTDANGCHGSRSGTVNVSLTQYPVGILSQTNVSCNGGSDGSATAYATGGTPPYTFEWSNGSSGATAGGLKAGSYHVIATDAGGCKGNTYVSISEPSRLSLSISGGNTTVPFCQGTTPPSMTLSASASGGTGPYNYSWPGGSITVNSSGVYTCSVTDDNGCTESASAFVLFIPVDCSSDPNDITGPNGFGEPKWMSVNDNLAYTVRFENDPDFATAPAQEVFVTVPLDNHADIYSLRIGDFGFGDFIFSIPPNTSYYTDRLDVVDSLGVFVDIIAGLDVNSNHAFWIFTSIDPATGLPPNDPNVGFLLVNDSITHRGEGFVSFNMKPESSTLTGDSITAFADIVFDINEPIFTNTWKNTIDAFPPVSSIDSIPAVMDSTSFTLSFSGQDDTGGSGVKSYLLYFSKNQEPYNLYGEYEEGTSAYFNGMDNSYYEFFSLGKDNVGNIEPMKSSPDVTTVITGGQLVLDLKVFIEGPFTGSGMSTALNNAAYVPLLQPYSVYPWYYQGTEAVTSIPNSQVVDWILVELRDAPGEASTATTTTTIGIQAGFLLNDGTVVSTDGLSRLLYPNLQVNNNLFVVIWHRNHLGIMSAVALQEVAGLYDYDFSYGQSQVYGGVLAHKELNPGVWGMIGGDGNADGLISNQDKIDIWTYQAGLSGYINGDFNLDGQVSNPDKLDMWLPNSGLGSQVPTSKSYGKSMAPQGGYKSMVPK